VKFIIHKLATREHLVSVIPEPFRSLLPPNLTEPSTVVLFGDRFATDRLARKALDQVSDSRGASLVFCARSFTVEAQAFLQPHEVILLAPLSHILWSDHQQEQFRVRRGATVKKPSIPYARGNA